MTEPKPTLNIQSKISFIEQQTEFARVLRFPAPENFTYLPGQFIMLKLELQEKNGFKILSGKPKIQQRAFSMSSSPTQKGFVETAVKEEEDGFVSKYLNRIAELGDSIIISGPYGHFHFSEGDRQNPSDSASSAKAALSTEAEEIVLLGAGSGITPLISILRYISDKKLSTRAILLYSNRSESDTIYYKDLQELEKKNSNIKIIFTMTRQPDWPGEKGRITLETIKKFVSEISKPIYFICGSPDFSKACKEMLATAGVPAEKVKTEQW